VAMSVEAGPNVGENASASDSATGGEVAFTYTGSGGAGTDSIHACIVDAKSGVCAVSVLATVDWVELAAAPEPTATSMPTATLEPVATLHPATTVEPPPLPVNSPEATAAAEPAATVDPLGTAEPEPGLQTAGTFEPGATNGPAATRHPGTPDGVTPADADATLTPSPSQTAIRTSVAARSPKTASPLDTADSATDRSDGPGWVLPTALVVALSLSAPAAWTVYRRRRDR
jgi:hypothetical protein